MSGKGDKSKSHTTKRDHWKALWCHAISDGNGHAGSTVPSDAHRRCTRPSFLSMDCTQGLSCLCFMLPPCASTARRVRSTGRVSRIRSDSD